MASKPYDIVLIPGSDLAKNAIDLSNTLSSFDVFFTLDNISFFPHVSLYMMQINDSQINAVFESLEKISKGLDVVYGKAIKYHYESDYFDVEYIKSNKLIQLQNYVIELLNPLRDGLREKDKKRILTAEGETLENLNKFGYRNVGNMFYPHMTFTRFKANQEHVLKSVPVVSLFSGNFVSLAICEMGDNGTCINIVKKWELANFKN